MKYFKTRLLLFTLSLIPLFLSAQVWQQNNIEYGFQYKGIKTTKALLIPTVQTTAAQGRDTGSIYYRLADSSIYVWTGSQWRTLGGGGGSSYVAGVGIKIDGSTIRWADTINVDHTIDLTSGKTLYFRGGTTTDYTRVAFNNGFHVLSQNTSTGAYSEMFSNSTLTKMRHYNGTTTVDIAAYGGYGNMNTFNSSRNTNVNVYPEYWQYKTDDKGFPTIGGMEMNGTTDSITIKNITGSAKDIFSFYPTYTRSYKLLKYNTYDSSSYDDNTLIPKAYLNQRLSAFSSGGITYHLINGATNLGSGSQVFKDTSSNKINLRSLTAGWGLDVTQNTDDIEYKADTAQLATSTAVRDTAQALRYIISGESVAWGTRAQRLALGTVTTGRRFFQTDGKEGEYIYNQNQWVYQPSAEQVLHNVEFTSTVQAASVFTVDNSGTGGSAGSFSNYRTDSSAVAGIYPLVTQAASSQARLYANYPDAALDVGIVTWREYIVRLSHRNDGTDNFYVQLGHIDSSASGVYSFIYTPDYGNQWVVLDRANDGTARRYATGVAVDTAVYQSLGIKRYSNDSTQYYINDVYVYTQVNGIASNNKNDGVNAAGIIIRKTAGSNTRSLFVDRISYILLRRKQ